MNTERIKEIQQATAYPNSKSVQQALLQVWHECSQEQIKPMTRTDKQLQTVYVEANPDMEAGTFHIDQAGTEKYLSKKQNVLLYTPEELEALLQNERREAASMAFRAGRSYQGMRDHYPNLTEYLNEKYPLPQPPKQQ